MPKYQVTTDCSRTSNTQIVIADICTQDPHWTVFTNKVEKRGDPDVMVASFKSDIVVSVINLDANKNG